MADPREVANRVGIGYFAETWVHDNTVVYNPLLEGGSAQVGLAMTVESSSVASLVGDGENVLGKLIKVEPGGICVIQTGGIMTLPGGAGATLTAGLKIVGDLGAASAEGYIQAVATQDTVSRGIIEDSSVATAVQVRMESAH